MTEPQTQPQDAPPAGHGSSLSGSSALSRLLAPVRGAIALAFVCGLAGAGLQLVPAVALTLLAEDAVAGTLEARSAWWYVVLAVLGLTAGHGIYLWGTGYAHAAEASFRHDLRRRITRHLARLPLGWHTSETSGRVRTVLTDDVGRIHSIIAHLGADLGMSVGSPLLGLAYLLTRSWQLTLLLLAWLVALLVVLGGLMMLTGRDSMTVFSQAQKDLATTTVEMVDGIATIKTFGAGDSLFSRFSAALERYTRASYDFMRGPGVPMAVLGAAVSPAGMLVPIVVGGWWMASRGVIEPVGIIPFILVGVGLPTGMSSITSMTHLLAQGRDAAESVQALLEEEQMVEAASPLPLARPGGDGGVCGAGSTRDDGEAGAATGAKTGAEGGVSVGVRTGGGSGTSASSQTSAGTSAQAGASTGAEAGARTGAEGGASVGVKTGTGTSAQAGAGSGDEAVPGPGPGARRRSGAGTSAGIEVELEDVSFRYREDLPWALRDVSLRLEPGTVTAVVGLSGSGKSTLVRLVARFWDVEHGRVRVGGVDVRHASSTELLSQMAIMLQEGGVLAGTVAANIRLARPAATTERVVEAARAARIHDRVMALPHGYDTVLGEEGAHLSGGEAQRLTLARAFLADAPLVLLDEATAQADPHSERLIQEGLASLAAGRTVLVIAHRLATVVGADQILVLDHGRLVDSGTHDELLARGGIYAAMWEAQQ